MYVWVYMNNVLPVFFISQFQTSLFYNLFYLSSFIN